MSKVLFVTSECWPLIKTGGLADISSSLPLALQEQGVDVVTLLPAYRGVKEHFDTLEPVANLQDQFFCEEALLLRGSVRSTDQRVWLLDMPTLFDRDGGPYQDENKEDWEDNAYRFMVLSRVACEIAMGRACADWQPDVVHCNDWQAGLIPALLSLEESAPVTVFTIHNIAYQGIYMRHIYDQMQLPAHWWHFEALEYHGNFSFLKGGIVFADRITTVSPTYSEEIKLPEKGCGLDGLLNHRADALNGILNGVDYTQWDPSQDSFIPYRYDQRTLKLKRKNKQALQKELGLQRDEKIPLIGVVGRFVYQKGIDLVIEQIKRFINKPVQWAILGSGDHEIEVRAQSLAEQFPHKVGVKIGYDEGLAHRIEAGADLFLMPSRYEPCGLNQMYSLRYGTVPVVTGTGGLLDTVVDDEDKATGFVATSTNADDIETALRRGLESYQNKAQWLKLRRRGMEQDFSWFASAEAYQQVYKAAMQEKRSAKGASTAVEGELEVEPHKVAVSLNEEATPATV